MSKFRRNVCLRMSRSADLGWILSRKMLNFEEGRMSIFKKYIEGMVKRTGGTGSLQWRRPAEI